ncbi:TIGR04255 family protein [Frankia sp. Cas3]|uniref:TIGR04255 family protein n=1 Tax=Frankia sp. Cas3 TaxID=3073926 RepID=UPI002AD4A40A|nr:TIGR04255 family protein [Frankia sp. Cas3]
MEEIHLRSAPLVRVIAQLRFPQLASMADGGVAHALASEMSRDYPLFEKAREINPIIAGSTISQQEQVASPVWRLQTADGTWLVTLERSSLSLEALAYAGRRDFRDRLIQLARVFINRAEPPRFDRFGIRYINRVTDPEILTNLATLVRSEMMAAATLELPEQTTLHHSLLEIQLDQGRHSMLARCGIFPAGTTIDPAIQFQRRISEVGFLT